MKDQEITNENIVSGIKCKKCNKSFNLKAGDHLGENEEKIAWGCPNCKQVVYGCVNCGSTLGIDCGEAEADFDSHFCSVGCFEEKAKTIYYD